MKRRELVPGALLAELPALPPGELFCYNLEACWKQLREGQSLLPSWRALLNGGRLGRKHCARNGRR